MTTLTPREPFSQDELQRLYPKNLKLQLVQVFLRHGERTPVSARFQNTGLPPYWPYCTAARQLRDIVATKQDISSWDTFQWQRKMETFGDRDNAVTVTSPGGETEGICQLGELTDRGRQTTFFLGQRLRYLYVDQLGFMPKVKSDAEDIYLRATPIPRALESVQQAFWGMYPAGARTASFLPPVIVSRSLADETLYPNEGNCRRFRQLSNLFAQRAANKWNTSEEISYLNSLWSKWMPASSPKVAVDSHPRLSGIMDTINASLAHGPATRLPSIFYDERGRSIIDKITVEEWFAGYNESSEYRKLGIGPLLGDIVDRMVSAAVHGGWCIEAPSTDAEKAKPIKFALSGCHDTTIAAILASIGAFENERWPQFTSSIVVELFSTVPSGEISEDEPSRLALPASSSKPAGFLSFLMGRSSSPLQLSAASETARMPLSSFSDFDRKALRSHYVRIRYNDRPMRIPGCAAKPTFHLPSDETFCTLEAFKEIVDKVTPRDWKKQCLENLDEGIFGKGDQEKVKAGY